MGNEFENDELDSAFSTLSPPMGQRQKRPFDSELKEAVCESALDFAETSPLLCGLLNTGVAKGRITTLTHEAVTQHCKSADGAKSAIENVSALLRFFLDFRSGEKVTLAGESSLVLFRDYLEQASHLRRAVPSSIRHSIGNWAAALQSDWPLGRALINSVSAIESNTAPKHAPSMAIATFKLPKGTAANKEVTPFKLQFADGVLLTLYGSLRFPDAQRVKTFEVNAGSIRGALLTRNARKQHGIDWPWARPLMGIAGIAEWIHPILDFREIV